MTISNEASGVTPDVSAAELPAVEKSAKPRARKSPAAAKKNVDGQAAPKSSGKKKLKTPETVEASAVDVSAVVAVALGADAAKAPAPKKTRARKSTPAQGEPVAVKDAPGGELPPDVQADQAVEKPAARPLAKKAPARKSPAKKSTATKQDAPPVLEAPVPPVFEDPAPAQASAPEVQAQEPEPAAPESEAPVEKPAGQRRRRGSRGRGRGSAAKKEAAREAAKSSEPAPAPAEQEAKALPAVPALPALEGAAPQMAIETGEVQKKSRRRKRGKGGGGSGEDLKVEAAENSVDPDEEEEIARPARAAVRHKRKMFVNVLAGEQVEVVISEEGQLREYYVEMLHQAKIKGNIYKGVIHNVDPNLQAAFVSYGSLKNGFLQIDEVHPEYYLTAHEAGKGHKYPLIQKVLKTGQEILVQVVKEPSGTKGAFLTSYLSIPGRYLVLTPGRDQIGVSRKVGNDSERDRLRDILDGLNPGAGLGVIVRTVSEGAGKTNLQRDLQMLKRVWKEVRKKGSSERAPALIYQELGLVARAVRDYLTDDVTELWVNDKDMAAEISEVLALMFPKRKDILQIHDDSGQSLFERFGLTRQIVQVQSREVVLPSGGRLVFDQTEALMAIDINSGRSGGKSNFEDMAFKINLEAAQHIPLQLRLRDIGGQIVVDFIEMRDRSHWREVEKTFRSGMKEDRARHDVGKISAFGLLEVVRQRLGSSAISIASEPCPFCKGTGIRRNMEWQAMQAMQEIQQLIRQNSEPGKVITYVGASELVLYLLNSKKEWLLDVEQENNVKLELRPGI